jgi:hypothetical protein
MSSSTVPVTLALLLRYRLMPSRPSLTYDDHYIVAAAFLLAHKFQDDIVSSLPYLAACLGLGKMVLMDAEMGLLKALGWQLWVGEGALNEVAWVFAEVLKLYG